MTQIMFPNQPDLVQQIPQPSELDIGKLLNGSIVTDTCDQAQKQRRLLALAVENAAQKRGRLMMKFASLKYIVGIISAMSGLVMFQNK